MTNEMEPTVNLHVYEGLRRAGIPRDTILRAMGVCLNDWYEHRINFDAWDTKDVETDLNLSLLKYEFSKNPHVYMRLVVEEFLNGEGIGVLAWKWDVSYDLVCRYIVEYMIDRWEDTATIEALIGRITNYDFDKEKNDSNRYASVHMSFITSKYYMELSADEWAEEKAKYGFDLCEAWAMYDLGYSISKLVKHFDVSYSTIWHRLDRALKKEYNYGLAS